MYTESFPGDSVGKESTCNAGDPGSIPGLGRSSGEGKGYSLQYFGLEKSMVCIFHGVPKSWTRLRDFSFTFHFHALEKEWQPTPVFLPGESQGWGILVGSHLWGRKELDTTEAT